MSDADLNEALGRITARDAHRWMVVKDGLDHGPFSGRELVELLAKGEIRGTHRLLNTDTGARQLVSEHPDFGPFAAEYDRKHAADRERAALATAERRRTRFGVVQVTLAGLFLLAVVGGALAFLSSRRAAERQASAERDLASLYERGDIEITGSAGILPEPKPRRNAKRRNAAARSAGYGSYEDAMNQAVNLGDATRSGGESRLSSAQVAGVMNRHINRLYQCVGQELRAGGQLSRVQIDLAIAGDGRVLGASARTGSPRFQSCIASRVRGIRFPTFAAPRMGARYSFQVD